MFDISWSELLILAVVTLLFVGPKELPVFLRTLGRYAGAVKRQASEFRSHFDEAMREAEIEAVRREVDEMQAKINTEVMQGRRAVDTAARGESQPQKASSETAPKPSSASAPVNRTEPVHTDTAHTDTVRAATEPPRPATPRPEADQTTPPTETEKSIGGQ